MNMPVNVTGPGFDCADPDVVNGRSRSAVQVRRRHHPIRLLVLLALVSLSFAPCASAQAINRIFFFGDSLSDPGNHFIFTHLSSRQPFLLGPPDASYDIGGHHFSDGVTWAEELATQLHSPNSGGPALRAPGVFTD